MKLFLICVGLTALVVGSTLLAVLLLSAILKRVTPDFLVRGLRANNKDDELLWWDDNDVHNREAARHPEYEFYLISENEEASVAVYVAYDSNGNLVTPPQNL